MLENLKQTATRLAEKRQLNIDETRVLIAIFNNRLAKATGESEVAKIKSLITKAEDTLKVFEGEVAEYLEVANSV